MAKDVVNVYWAPQSTVEVPHVGEWNLLYADPVSLFDELKTVRQEFSNRATFFSCPVTRSLFKTTYVFRNELGSSYTFDAKKPKPEVTPRGHSYLNAELREVPSLSTGPIIKLSMFVIFFADQPLEATFTPPMFHRPGYTQYGTVLPGRFDIGQWFRPYSLEFQMWDNKGEFVIKEGEPLFYATFNTDKKINLQRFKFDNQLHSYSHLCAKEHAKIWPFTPTMKERYSRFRRTRMRELILKRIKENVLEEPVE